jgi:peptidoglycan/LPS O-acetylase OafA/YrhL
VIDRRASRPDALKGRFLFLDGLRGLAALCVATFHFVDAYYSPELQPPLNAMLPAALRTATHALEYGVEVFFVLSGFVIAHSLFRERVTPGFAANFALRRSLRLDPPYWTILALAVGWGYVLRPSYMDGFFDQIGGWPSILVNMFYLTDFHWWRSIFPVDRYPRLIGVAWTLCLEVQFYVAYLGLLAVTQAIVWTGFRHARMVAGALFAGLAAFSIARWFANEGHLNDFGARWFMFFSGVLLYATLAQVVGRVWIILMISAVAIAGLVTWEPRSFVVVITAVSIYVAALVGGLQTWLRWPWLQHLGRLSYSFYLTHVPIGVTGIMVMMHFSDGSNRAAVASILFGFAISLAAAEALHRFVEGPAMRLSNRFKPKRIEQREAAMVSGIASGKPISS